MKFTANFYTRVIGGILLGYLGWSFGTSHLSDPPAPNQWLATQLLTLCGAGIGLLLTHYMTLYPFRTVRRKLQHMTLAELVAVSVGLLGGLLVGVLLTIPLSRLPVLGDYLPIIIALSTAYLGIVSATARKQELEQFINPQRPVNTSVTAQRVLTDTSVIIDGRISDVVRTGFICGVLVVPRFVLQEVQQLADSSDDLTRAKGKRGLEVLRTLQANADIKVEISDLDLPAVREVDDKLIGLARAEGMWLLTNDGNLQKIANLQQVRVLNLNELADAIRTPFMAGDHLSIIIRNEGREREQGVGFLQDGTMVVVEDARHLIGNEVDVEVTRLYTTQTGRIIFAHLDSSGGRPRPINMARVGGGR